VLLLCLPAQAQSIYGTWQTRITIQTGPYAEPYVVTLSLASSGSWQQRVQSQRFPDRYELKFGSFAPIGPDTYRFSVMAPQPGVDMSAFTVRIRLVSATLMSWDDLSAGGHLQFRRLR